MNAAVAAKSGEARLYRSRLSSRHTLLGVDQNSGEVLEDFIFVETVSLGEALEPFSVVHYLKMDCEGAEHSILASVGDETLSKIQRLVVEVHGLHAQGISDSMMRKLAASFNDLSIRRASRNLSLLFARKL